MSFYKITSIFFFLGLFINVEVRSQNDLAVVDAPVVVNVDSFSEQELNGLMMNGIKPNQLNSYQSISKFKQNRKIINYTALGFVAAGLTIGGIFTLACRQKSLGEDQCEVGVFVGGVLGATGAALTLLIAHPINRISNKKNDHSLDLNQYPNNSDITVSVGFVGNGIGLGVKF